MKNYKILVVIFFLSVSKSIAQSYVPEQENGRVKIKPVVDVKAYSFNLGEVVLLESPFKQAMEADTKYLLQIEPDRLLSEFRRHSGLKPKGAKYGGWEDSGLAGHSLGHYLSAIAMHYGVTHDPEYLKRVNYIVDELAECQVVRKTGYVGAIPKEDTVFMEVSQGNIRSRGFDLNGGWSPWYTVHKVMAGLLDAYLYCNNDKALQVELGMADWTGEILKNLNDEQIQKMLLCEYGGMNDVLVNTYTFTGNKKYLDLSYKFHDKRILDSLAVNIDVLPGKHSNTQVPKAIGTVRRYEVTGDKRDLNIGEFFWNTVVQHHTYAPGGNSNYEYLSKRDALNDKLTDNTMETCNTYNMLKLTRHLFALKPSASYMDFYERALYNHILASQNHSDGMMCYFVPLRMGTIKEFSDQFNTFTCCVGSGMENHVKYNESIYFKGKEGSLYVNLFIPSILTWKEKDLKITLNSNVPADQKVSLTINTKKSQNLPLHIRKPYWVENVVVKVNGVVAKDAKINEEGYIVINRKWKDKDVIELTLPATLHAMAMPDNASRQAFFYGPVLLAGNLGVQEPDPMKGVPVFVTASTDTKEWIKQDAKDPLHFTTSKTGFPEDVNLQPFYSIQNDHYSVYWDVFTPQAWKEQQKIYEEKRKAERDLEARTVDILRVGEMQPERDHNFTGDKTEAGESHTRKFRIANEDGSFTFTMKVDAEKSHSLIATYWGMDNRARTFDILVDGEKIATEDLNKFKESKFYDISYSVPQALTKGKQTVTITFKGKPHNQAGPVYGVRLVKEN
ncbi:MAG TPA: beta-L-arabinofuranosidase domain-containing protein [Cyclobacteriaceae bacterium]